MLRSEAWRTLPSDAKALLIAVWQRHNGVNNGEISFSVREAELTGLSKSVAARMFDVLIERGFLKVATDSAFHVKTRLARTWQLTMEPRGDHAPTRDFMRWTAKSGTPPLQIERQSPARDELSQQGDGADQHARKLPIAVPVPGHEQTPDADPPSRSGDTSNIPGSSVAEPRGDSCKREHEHDPIGGSQPKDLQGTGLLSPLQLRTAVRNRLATEGKGAVASLAATIGLSRSHLTNFLAGRCGINEDAAALLARFARRSDGTVSISGQVSQAISTESAEA
jgi:hypothetical protein